MKKNEFEICPRCGSKNVNWIIPQNWSQWDCKDCGYNGPIVLGDEEFSKEIHKAWLEKNKKDED